ncbi:hypothetical protein HNP84_001831 [Thermocatellispora tengchongensis]|uniref:Uncharacterized protein n=1 Tax=Thermocatellispora tengchongensis TaxID=1073253 RepID=A0A840NX75_9ACTN|nr:hypothetical protein [Thermocatellispora tengchongensis]MBB5132118.1 hypothetical protein [Thermocatellispora tengchongensis]
MMGPRRPAILAGAALAAVLTLTGCSGGGGTAPGAATPRASGSPGGTENSLAKWMTCMRENGVPVEDPRESGRLSAAGTGVGAEVLEKAQEACRRYVQSAAVDRPNANDAGVMDKYLAYARCMRENGVDMPDPVADANGEIVLEPKTATDSPRYVKAHTACESRLPGGAGGPR